MADQADRQRLDKWLWFARFFKTRSLATKQVSAGHVRVNSVKVSKPSQGVSVGDVLTFPQGGRIRVVRVEGVGVRRGPASEAATLFSDMSPQEEKDPARVHRAGKGRPTGKDRRAFDLLSRRDA